MVLIPGSKDEYEFSGPSPDLWFALQEVLNFTYVLKKPKDGGIGSMNKNGTWTTGLIGAVNSGESDMGMSL